MPGLDAGVPGLGPTWIATDACPDSLFTFPDFASTQVFKCMQGMIPVERQDLTWLVDTSVSPETWSPETWLPKTWSAVIAGNRAWSRILA
ncbi:hypothetical protein [Rubripirellula lacrimiformis]|uniref:hypothetical protein n=1 Tax=Rubripirellula lacrimiformis TaxID=1930273 RepID=UPI0011A7AC6D|nr:hypothetical protein [Rubripirellula lacrimiformis]